MSANVRFWIGFSALLVIGLWESFQGEKFAGPAFLLAAFLVLALGKPRD